MRRERERGERDSCVRMNVKKEMKWGRENGGYIIVGRETKTTMLATVTVFLQRPPTQTRQIHLLLSTPLLNHG